MNQRSSAAPIPSLKPNPLSQREHQILQLLAQGLTNKEMAAALCISHQTVSTHIKCIYDKLEVHTRVQAVIVGQQQGLIRLAQQDIYAKRTSW